MARSQRAGMVLTTALAALLGTSTARAAADAAVPPANIGREATLAEYRQHLVELNAIVAACAKARDTKSCDPALLGQDDHVPLSNAPDAERRLVRYNWLRALLAMAQEKDQTPEKAQDKGSLQDSSERQDKTPAKPSEGSQQTPAEETTPTPKPNTSQLLQAAELRLAQDIAQADAMGAASPAPAADHANERNTMKQVLSGRDFRNLETSTARDTLLEKLGEWLNRLWESSAMLQAHAAWVGRVIVWGFILAVCVGLAWGLLQLERRWRIRLVPESDGPAAGAASARDWQLWLADARRAVAAGQWREAIHFVYWATISRLESKRLWPADRARTPREYLALVAAEDPRKAGLATLTGSFERTWYGGRAAAESDYAQAEKLADGLILGTLDPERKLSSIESHPSRKNKDAARVGHLAKGGAR
ncbi:MAG: DUF4129 domain-containing protein [Terracidiphilus sp.]